MPDRDNVIKRFADYFYYFKAYCIGDIEDHAMLKDVLELLKEQPEIIRCKDCKNACVYDDDEVICTHIDSNGNDKHPADWFCADGERRTDKPDREKVIRTIEGCINIYDYCNKCDYDGCVFNHGSCEKDLLADALALLKEQPEIVRCKDCIHFDGCDCKVNDIVNIMDTEWFCADGKRKDS